MQPEALLVASQYLNVNACPTLLPSTLVSDVSPFHSCIHAQFMLHVLPLHTECVHPAGRLLLPPGGVPGPILRERELAVIAIIVWYPNCISAQLDHLLDSVLGQT